MLTLRLPRALVAILAGAALAVSGHLFQTLVRNPLASPDIIGVTSGAALVAVGIVVLGASSLLIPMGALAGAIVAVTVIYLLAWRGGLSPYRFVLVGVGIAAICQAATSYLLVRGELADVQQAAVWLVGSLNGRSWAEVWPLTVALGAAPARRRRARPLPGCAEPGRGRGHRTGRACRAHTLGPGRRRDRARRRRGGRDRPGRLRRRHRLPHRAAPGRPNGAPCCPWRPSVGRCSC